MKLLIKNFIKCGVLGWCIEIIFTALNSLRRRQMTLMGTTSLWMFPIYGIAGFFTPIFHALHHLPVLVRGLVYTSVIFFTEYTTGSLLKKYNLCPWSYKRCRFHIRELIRLDYIPFWFGAGLLFEWFLSRDLSE